MLKGIVLYFYKEIKMAANEQVLEALKRAGKPLKSAEIAKAAGLDPKETATAIKELKKAGALVSPKNCYYSIA
jgi:DNA-binding IclR family transcriptional regulator